MRRDRPVWLALSALTLTMACGEGDESGQPPDEAFCDAYCHVYWECEQYPGYYCKIWCLDESESFVHLISDDALALSAECLPDRSCLEVDDGEFVQICLESVEPDVDPTETLVDFCEVMSPTWFDCGYLADVYECIDSSYKLWSDDVLDRASDCASVTCEELDPCLDAAFSG